MSDGEITFERVEQQGRDRESLRSSARDVGGADVAAAGLANVFSAEDANQQISEWNRAQEVRRDDDDESAVDPKRLFRLE